MSGIPIQISARKWPWPSSTISSCCSWTSSTINKRRCKTTGKSVGMCCKTTWVPNQEVGPLKLHIETPEVKTLNHQKWVQWRTVQPSRRIDFPEIIGFFLIEKWIGRPAGTHSKHHCSTGSCSLRCISIWFYMIFEGSSHLTESMDFGKTLAASQSTCHVPCWGGFRTASHAADDGVPQTQTCNVLSLMRRKLDSGDLANLLILLHYHHLSSLFSG